MKLSQLPEPIRSKIVKKGSCWEWTGPITAEGLPQVWVDGKTVKLRGYMWLLIKGIAKKSIRLRTTCGNRLCVAPAHLTNLPEVVKLPAKKTRGGKRKNGNAKLNETQVSQIKDMARKGMTRKEIAAKFGVGAETVGKILRGLLWSHVK